MPVIKFPQRSALNGSDQGEDTTPYDVVYLKDTDTPLPETINYRTRYAYVSIAGTVVDGFRQGRICILQIHYVVGRGVFALIGAI